MYKHGAVRRIYTSDNEREDIKYVRYISIDSYCISIRIYVGRSNSRHELDVEDQ